MGLPPFGLLAGVGSSWEEEKSAGLLGSMGIYYGFAG